MSGSDSQRPVSREYCENCPSIASLVKDVALVNQEVNTMGAWQKTWDGRIWAIVGATVLNLLAALGTLGFLLFKSSAVVAAVAAVPK